MAEEKPGQNKFECIIVTPDQVIFEGEASRLMAPGIAQYIAVLPNHTPLYSELQEGKVVVDTIGDGKKDFDVDGGILRVRNNKASVIVGF